MAMDHGADAATPEQPMAMDHGADAATPEQPMAMDHGGHAAGGLRILPAGAAVDRVVDLSMSEWGYAPGTIEVAVGERIRLKIRNDGTIPHEFMFMTMTAMSAVGYRSQRADWNLLEHEALYEQPLVLPGGSFEIALEIREAGSWMFMCMFPYHMQFGLMGAMSTAGGSMQPHSM